MLNARHLPSSPKIVHSRQAFAVSKKLQEQGKREEAMEMRARAYKLREEEHKPSFEEK